jgi:hypothetical protein
MIMRRRVDKHTTYEFRKSSPPKFWKQNLGWKFTGAEKSQYKMTSYNGHRSWDHWNVSLWINNDEPLYRLALSCLKYSESLETAVESMFKALKDAGLERTLDGAEYTRDRIRAAIINMELNLTEV